MISDLAVAEATRRSPTCGPPPDPITPLPGFRMESSKRDGPYAVEMIPVPGLRALTLMARPLRDLSVDLAWKNWDFSLGDLELL